MKDHSLWTAVNRLKKEKMGFFDSAGSNKTDLIRLLLIERVRIDPLSQAQGVSPFMVRQLLGTQIAGSIEAGIVTIVETFFEMALKGITIEDSLMRIEQHRKTLGSGRLPVPLDLATYIEYRASIEHNGSPLPQGHTTFCINAAQHFFIERDDKGDAAHSIKHALLAQKTEALEKILATLSAYFEGEITDDQFLSALDDDVCAWQEQAREQKKRTDVARFKANLKNLE